MRALALYGAATTLGSLVLTALTAAPAGGAAAPAPVGPPASPEAHGTALAAERALASGIAFGRCPASESLPDSVRCGTVKVPLDYAKPHGKQIELTVSRLRARGKETVPGTKNGKGGTTTRPVPRQGALVYNPGGPGASSMYFPLAAGLPEWKKIAGAYDLVGYSPRGVARSAPLSCVHPKDFAQAPTQSPVHPSESYKKERIARAKTYARGCARKAGDALRHYHSLNNARDLEVLRAALGEPKLNFMGASYGTYFGALYATLYPSHVRRMVFDSAVNPDPEQIWYRNNLDQSAAFEQRWADFRTWVAKHHKVYGLGATPRAVQHSYARVRAELAHKPAGKVVGPGQLHSTFLQAGYYDDVWPMRATALSEYLKGNPQPLIDQASPRPETARDDENGNAVYTAVECNDAPWPTHFATWDRDNTQLAERAPFETWDNAWMNLPCAYWSTPRQQPVDVRTAEGALPPTLILAAERDAATPYKGALELQKRLPGAALVTEKDAGTHGIGGGSNACVNKHLDTYLLTGETPVRRAVCAPHREPNPVSLDERALPSGIPAVV
ncbi:alpha/beta hydrolase [Streptomyces candidus]|uniref:Pimeloyl-ACP methyl ester carboxylesterase n=1 Tax=Streptomyces candidus TaxID=67283 RepID=A0A7X0HDU9_9ACTN|nr:alpha/beta hydrolase [Streptomyces candidus]MBB6434393.1 pimeloyl-ACP methyl ester carboxylesterase [Streptomyces candidus]GHH36858.1 protease [Streptomyces candidus]